MFCVLLRSSLRSVHLVRLRLRLLLVPYRPLAWLLFALIKKKRQCRTGRLTTHRCKGDCERLRAQLAISNGETQSARIPRHEPPGRGSRRRSLESDKFEVYATTRSAKSAEALKARGVKAARSRAGRASAKARTDAAEPSLVFFHDAPMGSREVEGSSGKIIVDAIKKAACSNSGRECRPPTRWARRRGRSGAFVLNRQMSTGMRSGISTEPGRPRHRRDVAKNYQVHPTHWVHGRRPRV